ncbi:MAG: hypothetical protein KJ559_00115 [Nanoarchaeota archaeon]|nr:hypothetical protein [Nanoarchaeota archaeon]
MPVDISGFGYFMPIFGLLFVFVIVYALLDKTKILGDNKFINIIIGAIIAIVFATVSNVQDYVQLVTPWFVVLVVLLFFTLILIGLSQQDIGSIMKPWFVWVFIVLLILVFLFSATNIFSSSINSVWDNIVDFATSEARIAGAILVLIIGGITAWILVK